MEPNVHIKSGELWAGNPAVCVRHLTDMEMTSFKSIAAGYISMAQDFVDTEVESSESQPFAPFTELCDEKIEEHYSVLVDAHPHTSNMPKQANIDRIEEGDDVYTKTKKMYAKYEDPVPKK